MVMGRMVGVVRHASKSLSALRNTTTGKEIQEEIFSTPHLPPAEQTALDWGGIEFVSP